MWIRLWLLVASVAALPHGGERDEATVERKFLQVRNKIAMEESGNSDRLLTPREKNLLTASKSFQDNVHPQEYYYRRWPNNVIPIEFHSDYSPEQIQVMHEALHELESKSCFRFPDRQGQEDYIFFEKGSGGCSSYVGRTGGRQSLFLGDNCIGRNVIQHEVMHAIGFAHEHQRIDRDDHIEILWDNVQPGSADNFNKENYRAYGRPYAFESIMHYRSRTFGKKDPSGADEPTMRARVEGFNLDNDEMNDEDYLRLRSLGRCPGGSPPDWPRSQEDDLGIQNRAILDVDCSDAKKSCRKFAQDGYCGHEDSADLMKKLCPNACKPECLPK